MKTKTLYRILTEAARFGNNEKRYVFQHKNEFRIGIEYEFHVDGANESSDIDTGEMSEDEIMDRARSIVIEGENIWPVLDDAIEPFRKLDRNGDPLEEALTNVGEAAEDLAVGEISPMEFVRIWNENEEDLDDLKYLGRLIFAFDQFDSDLKEAVYFVDNDFFPDSFGKYFSKVSNLLDEMDNAIKSQDYGYLTDLASESADLDWVGELVYDMDQFFSTLMPHRFNPSELAEQIVETPTYIDRVLLAADNVREEEEEGGFNDAVEIVSQSIDGWIDATKLNSIVEDPSVPDGVEVISEPLPLDLTFKFMEDVFGYIENHGSTSNKTGMHVNISHKDFRKMTDVNLLKILILTDPDFMQSIDRGVIKWRERNHMVAGIYNELRNNWNNILNSLMSAYDRSGISGVEDTLRDTLVRGEKFKSVNFTYMLGDNVGTDGSRIEFRFFGGSGYEDRFDDIERDIYFLCYTILAGVDEDFLRREYLSDLVRLLNKISMEYSGVTFVEFYNQWKIDGDVGTAQLSIVDKFERKGYNYKG